MQARQKAARAAATVLVLTGGLAACADHLDSPIQPEMAISANAGGARTFEVFTQNLFLGGDTGPILTADFSDIPGLVALASTFWGDVLGTDFPERAVEIVDEIEARMPHVIGLQEALNFVVLDGSFQPIGVLDMLAVMEAEIASRGLPYVTEAVQQNTTGTMPLELGATGITKYLNFTDRIATLRRTDVEVVEEAQGEYAVGFPVGPITLKRGWIRTAVAYAGTTYHVLNTHLEIQALAPVQAGQVFELRNAILPGLEGVTVVIGDLNSDAEGMAGDPSWTPTYGELIGDGFVDLWDTAPPANRDEVGLTCCREKSLLTDDGYASRIDFVLVRSSDPGHDLWGAMRGEFRVDRVGEDEADRTPGGLWPSDHAGLFGSMRIPFD